MKKLQSLPWASPLDYAASLRESCWTLLYSGLQAGYSGRFSLLAFDLAERIEATDFTKLEARLTHDQHRFTNAWFGYFGYGLKNSIETLPVDRKSWLNLPPLTFLRFHNILEFDHENKTVHYWSDHINPPLPVPTPHKTAYPIGVCKKLTSNMSQEQYLSHVSYLIERIQAGDVYQANLTRKFNGNFESLPEPFNVFCNLCAISPAAYSAFLKLDDTAILSSSPELFLKVDANGTIHTRPVKGTAPRYPDTARDQASKNNLAASIKDKAENLMITDLMRNDLSRTCLPGSVKTKQLFEINSHSHVHHMSSTITGKKSNLYSTLQVISQAFPPGSMTGAPKITAIGLLSQLEQDERGVYSGALGWLGGDGSAELSVIIRTLLIKKDRFEFQIGGGIVADSTPEAELQEIKDKAAGILKLLNLSAHDMP